MIVCADSYQYLDTLTENSIDTVITDPPYGLKFMGKKWDYDIPRADFWEKVYRVCKPGAIMLIFGGTRTYHRLAVEIEDAGFEIRDTIMWLYGQGFPKSYDISKGIDKHLGKERTEYSIDEGYLARNPISNHKDDYQETNGNPSWKDGIESAKRFRPSSDEAQLWDGWGTALKPAWEPIIVAMKPLDGTYAGNALKYGVAGLNIAGSRIGTNPDDDMFRIRTSFRDNRNTKAIYNDREVNQNTPHNNGRFPANIILDEEAAQLLDEQSGELKVSGAAKNNRLVLNHDAKNQIFNGLSKRNGVLHNDKGGASRFFYVAKASRSERGKDNDHPTVKPIALLEYLCKLTETPTGGIVLDPFMGSGSLGIAARNMGRKYLGIEIDKHYFDIAKERIEAWKNK